MSTVRGSIKHREPLSRHTSWRVGGPARTFFEPADRDDLINFVRALPVDEPLLWLGLGSNLLVRDGGFAGTVIHLHGALDALRLESEQVVFAEAGTHCARLAKFAKDEQLAGLGFMAGIPGTVGGFVRMNGGAYGREVKDILIDCDVVIRSGEIATLPLSELGYTYRHSDLTDGSIVVAARFRGAPGEPAAIQAEMDRISAAREASQPLRSKTGGSTFKNPDGGKAWELVDKAGCRGLTVGGAQVSEKHTNFLLNTGKASSADIEALGEEVRRRVLEHSGVSLEWEIKRIGEPLGAAA